MARSLAAADRPMADRLPRLAERLLRVVGDGRTGLALLLVAGAANLVAALIPDGPRSLDGWPYAVLLGAVALSAVAAVAVRAPATWREWRRPGSVPAGPGALTATLTGRPSAESVADALTAAGYRTVLEQRRGRWAVHGVRRGWARLAGHATHLALVLVVLGVAVGAAFGSETTFSLHPGDQALLDAPGPGFAAAIRLERVDAEFDPNGRPLRLDAAVAFLRDGEVVEERVLRVNEPGSFDGYLVHPWTYGPAARLRVTTLAGSPLLDAPVPLPDRRDGTPVGSIDLPTLGASLGLSLTDAAGNELGVSLVGADGLVDVARLRPGEERRLGDVIVELSGFDAWVTFLSRRDPGLPILFGGAALLSAGLAIGFWLPRRRVTVRPAGADTLLVLRGERFDRHADELERLRARLVGLVGGGAPSTGGGR